MLNKFYIIKEHLYKRIIAAEATSQFMQFAVDKARVAAVSNLSQIIKSGCKGYLTKLIIYL